MQLWLTYLSNPAIWFFFISFKSPAVFKVLQYKSVWYSVSLLILVIQRSALAIKKWQTNPITTISMEFDIFFLLAFTVCTFVYILINIFWWFFLLYFNKFYVSLSYRNTLPSALSCWKNKTKQKMMSFKSTN